MLEGITDCYAGNIEVEGQGKCSCSQGKAKTTGDTLNIPHVSEHTAPCPIIASAPLLLHHSDLQLPRRHLVCRKGRTHNSPI